MPNKTFFNWSGGKDSAFALYHILQDKRYLVDQLFTSINKKFNRVSMHGVRVELLDLQAENIGLPLTKMYLPEQPDMDEYNRQMKKSIGEFKKLGYTHSAFGDIFLEDLKKYREDKLSANGFSAVFPIWKQDTTKLLNEFLDLGFKTILVCVNANKLGKEFCCRIIDKEFIKDLPADVDPCGENGEFHTFVFDGPIFKKPVPFEKGEVVYKEYEAPKGNSNDEIIKESYGYWFCDLLIKNTIPM